MEEIKKALNIIALKNSEGIIPDDIFVKACDAYKIKSEVFIEDYDYHIYVSKSFFDHLNGISADKEICKAILPGQTKVVDGVMYIYALTPGAKTEYDWRVFKGKNKVGKQVDDSKVDSKQKYINELFPYDLNSLKVIKGLGDSTGSQLVEDDKGNQFVMKEGSNTSSDHVRAEYLSNQLYDIMGLRVPDCELYDYNGEAILLSKYIPFTTSPSVKDYDQMAKGFVVDALLANFDIYQNDNCLIDSAGRVIRVNNGGSLNYREQGSKKTFGDKVSSFLSMQTYNPTVVANLTTQDYINQINDVLSKKDDVINFLDESKQLSMSDTFKKRFDDLEHIKNDLIQELTDKSQGVLPRILKRDAEMYRDFTDEELDVIWKNQEGKSYRQKFLDTDPNLGWKLLSDICIKRGFSGRPQVVEKDEYWDIVSKSKYQMFRGLEEGRINPAKFYADKFKYDDDCFYGTLGLYGSGIYAHVNDGDKDGNDEKSYLSSNAYNEARNYAKKNGEVLELVLDPSAKVALVSDLRKEILKTVLYNTKEVDKIQLEIDSLNEDLERKQEKLKNKVSDIEKEIKKNMHWDEDTLVASQNEIDNIDWGNLNDKGDPDYPSFEDFVEKKVFDWVNKNGGTVTEKGKDVYVFALPNSKEKFTLSRYQWENNAIKQKNALSKAYNYPLKSFQNWMMKEHYGVIDKKVAEELKNISPVINQLQSDIVITENELERKNKDILEIKQVKNPDDTIMSGIYSAALEKDYESIGVYAALKGYDALIQPNGNGSSNSFMIILNRTKVIVKK